MMYPRLKLARNLLKDDGVIFISIDDNEMTNMKKLCDEIFGEDNFIANFLWEKRITRENRKVVSVRHDYILCYAKNIDLSERALGLLPMNEEARNRYNNPDNDPRGVWTSVPAIAQAGHGTKNQFYTLITPSGRKVNPPSGSCWRYTEERMKSAILDNRIWFGSDGNGVPRIKKFITEGQQGLTPESLWWAKEVGTNDTAKRELTKLFNDLAVFETPKPFSLIQRMLYLATNDSSVILDFFAGTSPTAHAVMQLNAEDGGNRRYIMVQLPEPTDEKSEAYKAGYKTIAEIGKERIRRAGEKILEDGGLKMEDGGLDVGFKVFKLDSSNIKAWDPDYENLEQSLLDTVDNVKPDRTEADLLYEILLKYGLDLTLPIEELTLAGKKVYVVGSGSLIICLDKEITLETVEEIAKLKEKYGPDDMMRVVFRDNGFKDVEVKTNAIQILKQYGVGDVKSL